MITEQLWKHKPHKLTVIQVNANDHEAIKTWLGATAVSILHRDGEPSRLTFEGGDVHHNIHVSDGELLSKDENGNVNRWVSEEHLKRDYKRA